MSKKIIILIFMVGASLILTNELQAWNDRITHKDVSENAAKFSLINDAKLFENVISYEKGLEIVDRNSSDRSPRPLWRKHIEDGAIEEDAGNIFTAYYYNHFHNPLVLSWDQAGLSTIYPFISGKSSLLWAQDTSNPWSWQKTREYYYKALSSTAADRNANFEQTFKGLGHAIHLIQDAAQPAHVRNDPHPLDDIGTIPQFEYWAKTNRFLSLTFMSSPIFPTVFLSTSAETGYIPITQLWDTNQYNGNNPPSDNSVGISEYTNANFFSEDTVYLGNFPYPSFDTSSVVVRIYTRSDGTSYQRQYYLKNCCGETNNGQGYLLSAVDYLDYYRQQYPSLSAGLPKIPVLDNNVYSDYASLLLPRAVGYSAGLLNYFFRGTLEITAPDTYVYSIIDGSINPQQFTKIKAKVKNTTPNEQMQNGTLTAVAKYKKRTDYAPDLSTDPPTETSREPEFSYSVSADIPITSLDSATPTEFTFNFENSPIPAGITDLYLIVVFKGTLGNEIGNAIAAGMKDIKEPTHHTFWNLTDRFSLGIYDAAASAYIYHLYKSDEIKSNPDLAKLVDKDGDGEFNEIDIGEPRIDPYDITFNISYMESSSPDNPPISTATAVLPPGRYMRLIVLVDSKYNNYVRTGWADNIDTPPSAYIDMVFEGVINQDINGVWQTPTPVTIFRGIREHFYTGLLRCEPLAFDPTTMITYCPYPKEEEPPPADATPYQATINFK